MINTHQGMIRYEGTLDPWMLSLWRTLYQINPKYFPKGPDVKIPQDEVIDKPKYRILFHKQEKLEPKLLSDSGMPKLLSGYLASFMLIYDYVVLLNIELPTC
jgi:hypothetical protein